MRWIDSRWCGALVLVLAMSACGGGAGGGASGYTANLGAVEGDKLVLDVQDFLRRQGFDLDLNNGPPAILLQSHWRPGLPGEGERAAGATEVRTRIRVSGRERQITEASAVYVATLRIERQVRMGAEAAWQEMPAASDFLDWARTVSRELELDLQSGRGG